MNTGAIEAAYIRGDLPNITWADRLVVALRQQFGWTDLDYDIRRTLEEQGYDFFWSPEGREAFPEVVR